MILMKNKLIYVTLSSLFLSAVCLCSEGTQTLPLNRAEASGSMRGEFTYSADAEELTSNEIRELPDEPQGELDPPRYVGRKYMLEARAAYFYPTNSQFRKVYSENRGIYGLEFDLQVWKRLFAWASIDYFSSKGKTDIDKGHTYNPTVSCTFDIDRDRTHITIVPLGLGLKYFFNKGPAQFYLGAGVLIPYLHTHVHSKYLVRNRSQWGVGGAFKSGVLFHLPASFLIDIFTDYFLMDMHLHRTHHKEVITHRAHLSGFSFGAGVGYAF
jgi:hypothetical protein